MRVRIVTPTGVTLDGEAQRAVELPSVQGRMQVLPSHAPLLAALQAGSVWVDDKEYPIAGGIARVEDDCITVIC